tara:strand:+ start:705 stop:932 length:228 start_codon:yes stop_codon:yes gene_type:complete
MANKKKPTNKELLNEINLIGNKMMDLYVGLRNLGNIFDLYLVYKEDQESFNKFIQEKLKEKVEADKKAKEEKPKD